MARKVGIDGLQDALEKILEEYGDEIEQKNEEVVQKVGRKGAKALRESASGKFNGNKYAPSWSVTFEGDRIHQTAIIYNKRMPGLAHLLEHGHAKRGGGRTDGNPHIKPVEEEIVKLFEDTLRREL
jgi:hypothetical protein